MVLYIHILGTSTKPCCIIVYSKRWRNNSFSIQADLSFSKICRRHAYLVIFLLWLTSHNAWLKSCYTMYDVYIGPVFSIQMYYCTRDSRSKLVSLRRKEDYIHAPITLRKVCFLMRRTSTGEVELSKYYTSLHWKYTGHNSLILNLARQKSFLNVHLK